MKTKSRASLLVNKSIADLIGSKTNDHICLGRYQAQMLRSLKEVGSVDSIVGFYQATRLGAFLKQPLVEAQAIHQEKLRHGGIVIIHGKFAALGPDLVLNFRSRHFENSPRECVFQGIPLDQSIRRCIQEKQLQHSEVRASRSLGKHV